MIGIDTIWLVLAASDLRGCIDWLLAMVAHCFALGAQAHHAYVFANRRAHLLKVLVCDGAGMWLCIRRLQAGSFAWPREDSGLGQLSREQLDWLDAGLPRQRSNAPPPQRVIKRALDPKSILDPGKVVAM